MNHQYSGRSQKSRGIKARHVLLAILILVMGFWSLFQIKHSGYRLLVQKLKDGSLGRKGLVEPIDESEIMDMPEKNVITEGTSLEENGSEDEDENEEVSRAEALYKDLLFRSVDNSTGMDSVDEFQDDASEAERPIGDNGFQDENGIPPAGHESEMPASFEPRSSGLSMDDETEKSAESDGSTETNGSDDKADHSEKDLNVDTNYDEKLETQK